MANLSYDYVFRETGDKRLEDWFMMKDFRYPALVIFLYIFGILKVMPRFMKDRPAYNLKTVIQAYNIFQIISCFYVLQGVLRSGWLSGKITLGCVPLDFSNDFVAMEQLKFCYYYIILKMTDLIETFFFALRHKQNQISNLHLYHHCTMIVVAWVGCKYYGGGMTTFSVFMNCGVHVLMYTYYFLSAFGPKIQKKLAFIKPKLTMLQMTQFAMIVLHSLQGLRKDEVCSMYRNGAYMLIINVVVIWLFFINFYIQQYKKKKST